MNAVIIFNAALQLSRVNRRKLPQIPPKKSKASPCTFGLSLLFRLYIHQAKDASKCITKMQFYSNYGNNARRQGKDECLLLSARLIYFCIKPISFLTGIFSKSSL